MLEVEGRSNDRLWVPATLVAEAFMLRALVVAIVGRQRDCSLAGMV